MKYLDERIIIRVDFGTPMPIKGMYRYSIYEYRQWAMDDDDELIFTGNLYYDRNSRYKDIDITDIVRSRKYTPSSNFITDTGINTGIGAEIRKQYRIRIYLDGSEPTTQWELVNMVYRYPNVKRGLTDGSNLFFTGGEDIIRVSLQGYHNYGSLKLYPHYPLVDTSNYKFSQTFIHSNDVQEFMINYYQRETQVNDYYTTSVGQDDKLSTSMYIPLHNLIDFNYYQVDFTKNMTLYLVSEEDAISEVIGYLDGCPKRYYLMWQDRFGGYQSQAFGGAAVYSETYSVTETQNYKNERKKSFIQVQPKWKLTSGWISEELYPYYESIMVSPIVLLYDTQEDVSYPVIVNGNYTEKTYKNVKKMLNLSLDLEAISKQNIMY